MMRENLLIIGAGAYAQVAAEIAADMGVFQRVAFVDDNTKILWDGSPVAGTTSDIERLAEEYGAMVVAIGNSQIRLSLLQKIKEKFPQNIVSLVSPRAYISPAAKVLPGCIIEPMAVVHSQCVLEEGCIISAGAVVNHTSTCCSGVHVDCNSTVAAYARVPAGTKIFNGEVYSDV